MFVLLRIDSSSIPAYQVCVRPIRLQQIFLSMLFKVEGQVVNWPTSTFTIGRGVCSRCRILTLQLTLVGAASRGTAEDGCSHWGSCCAVGVLFVPLVVESVGCWSDEAIYTIASIGHLQGHCLGIPPSGSIRHLFSDWPSRYGERTPHCVSTASQSVLPTWTD